MALCHKQKAKDIERHKIEKYQLRLSSDQLQLCLEFTSFSLLSKQFIFDLEPYGRPICSSFSVLKKFLNAKDKG